MIICLQRSKITSVCKTSAERISERVGHALDVTNHHHHPPTSLDLHSTLVQMALVESLIFLSLEARQSLSILHHRCAAA